jgi:hypothetical protein
LDRLALQDVHILDIFKTMLIILVILATLRAKYVLGQLTIA